RTPHRTPPQECGLAVARRNAAEPRESVSEAGIPPSSERAMEEEPVRAEKTLGATIVLLYGPARPDGTDRQPREATRVRVPVERDLRRVPEHLGLRTARRPPEAQRQGRMVAHDGAATRRRRRPRRRHPDGTEGLGGERSSRDLHRPARRLPEL